MQSADPVKLRRKNMQTYAKIEYARISIQKRSKPTETPLKKCGPNRCEFLWNASFSTLGGAKVQKQRNGSRALSGSQGSSRRSSMGGEQFSVFGERCFAFLAPAVRTSQAPSLYTRIARYTRSQYGSLEATKSSKVKRFWVTFSPWHLPKTSISKHPKAWNISNKPFLKLQKPIKNIQKPISNP